MAVKMKIVLSRGFPNLATYAQSHIIIRTHTLGFAFLCHDSVYGLRVLFYLPSTAKHDCRLGQRISPFDIDIKAEMTIERSAETPKDNGDYCV